MARRPGIRNREEYWWGRTARKRYLCGDMHCDRVIEPGDRYVEMKLPPGGEMGYLSWSQMRTCVPCAAKFNAELAQRALSLRPWTPDEKTETGMRVTVKRACNGCGWLLGDVTAAEIDRAVAGYPPLDATAECPRCSTGGA